MHAKTLLLWNAEAFQAVFGDGQSLKKLQFEDLLVEVSTASQQSLSNCSTTGTLHCFC